jgi:hypothetical protein
MLLRLLLSLLVLPRRQFVKLTAVLLLQLHLLLNIL